MEKIFVSHRIDIKSELLQSELYMPVRCGAVYDDSVDAKIIGDNSGINISEKRLLLGELTVQYWAWKNCDLDYYGLCHYRRYLSFAEKNSDLDVFNMIPEPAITAHLVKKHHLEDEKKIRNIVTANDLIFLKGSDVKKMCVKGGYPQTVRELWDAHHNLFIDKKYIDILFDLIRENNPNYYQSAKDYFASDIHYGFNCFVMKKELFNRLCEFQFPILFELEPRIVAENYTGMMERILGYLGEMMYGIFIYHLINVEKRKYREFPVVFFMSTTKVNNKLDYYIRWIREYWRVFVSKKTLKLLPRGSKRREFFKKFATRKK